MSEFLFVALYLAKEGQFGEYLPGNMREKAGRLGLCLLFLLLGLLITYYPLPGPSKLLMWLSSLSPGLFKGIKADSIQTALGFLNIIAAVFLLKGPNAGKQAAIVGSI